VGNATRQEVTRHLIRLRAGDPKAAEELLPLVYNELRALAQSYLAHRREGNTLQATSIVHEVYLRLVDQTNVDWESRAHFSLSPPRPCASCWWTTCVGAGRRGVGAGGSGCRSMR